MSETKETHVEGRVIRTDGVLRFHTDDGPVLDIIDCLPSEVLCALLNKDSGPHGHAEIRVRWHKTTPEKPVGCPLYKPKCPLADRD